MLRVLYENDLFVCSNVETESERRLARSAGFTFDSKEQRWFCETPKAAARLREYCTGKAKEIINRHALTFSPWLGPLPLPKGFTLHEFQGKKAIPFVLARNRSYLALPPGLGKTICAAVVSNATRAPLVYICPPFLTLTVQDEFRKWITWTKKIGIYEDTLISLPDILIVPDSLVHREDVQAAIRAQSDFGRLLGVGASLVVDEAHRFKTPGTRRTRAIFGAPVGDRSGQGTRGILDRFSRHLYLSGTPMPNGRPMELFPLLSKVAPETIDWRSEIEFGLRYCAGKKAERECSRCEGKGFTRDWVKRKQYCRPCRGKGGFFNGYDFTGASHVKELRDEVMSKFMLRISKKEALPELPPKTEQVVLIGKSPPRLLKAERDLRAASPVDLMGEQFGSPHTATYCRLLGQLKVKPASEFISDVLDGGENVLVFAYHKNVIRDLEKRLASYRPIVVDGSVSKLDRHGLVREFQTNRERKLFIGQYLACGVGYTLTKASRVIFVEQSWNPADNDQASDRAHRIGQRDHVFVQYLVYENSIDRTRVETNLRKRKTINTFEARTGET